MAGAMAPESGQAQSRVEVGGAGPAFEVASVKRSSPQAVGLRLRRDPGSVQIGNFTLIDIVAEAYEVQNHLVSGPPWMSDERYDIVAKVPKGVSTDQIPAMLKSLLVERFKLKVHRETKANQVYALTVGKGGPRLVRADAPATDLKGTQPAGGRNVGSSKSKPADGFHFIETSRFPMLGYDAVGVTMARFAAFLKSYLPGVHVVDSTGLQGRYNFTFQFDSRPEGRVPPDNFPPSLFTAVERLGLKLEPRKARVEWLIVDHAEKIPVEN